MNISPNMDDGPNPPFPYFADAKFSDFPYGPGGGTSQGFHDFFPGQQSQFPSGSGMKMSGFLVLFLTKWKEDPTLIN